MSYGLSVAGYDVRLAEHIFLPVGGHMRLGSTLEKFNMPTNVIAFVKDKSTLARKGLAVQNTVIEPGWRGFLTLELTNHGGEDLFLSPGQPIAQIVFQFLDAFAETPYSGKYQDQQAGPQAARREE